MKVGLFICGMVLVVIALVLGALVMGWALWGQQAWTARLPVGASPGETANGSPVPAGPGFCGLPHLPPDIGPAPGRRCQGGRGCVEASDGGVRFPLRAR